MRDALRLSERDAVFARVTAKAWERTDDIDLARRERWTEPGAGELKGAVVALLLSEEGQRRTVMVNGAWRAVF